eukprot:1570249-Rhodomonas_salina.2
MKWHDFEGHDLKGHGQRRHQQQIEEVSLGLGLVDRCSIHVISLHNGQMGKVASCRKGKALQVGW